MRSYSLLPEGHNHHFLESLSLAKFCCYGNFCYLLLWCLQYDSVSKAFWKQKQQHRHTQKIHSHAFLKEFAILFPHSLCCMFKGGKWHSWFCNNHFAAEKSYFGLTKPKHLHSRTSRLSQAFAVADSDFSRAQVHTTATNLKELVHQNQGRHL